MGVADVAVGVAEVANAAAQVDVGVGSGCDVDFGSAVAADAVDADSVDFAAVEDGVPADVAVVEGVVAAVDGGDGSAELDCDGENEVHCCPSCCLR